MNKMWAVIMTCLALISAPSSADNSGGAEAAGDGGSSNSVPAAEKELGFWFEARVDSKKEASLIAWYQRDVTEMFGVYGLVSLENADRYRQGYAGITMKPAPNAMPWLQVGAGLGRERDGESSGVRRNAFISVDSERVTGFASYEDGMTGPWHRVNLVYKVSDKVSIGAMQETDHGFGPRAEYHVKRNVTVWGAVLRDRTVFAVNFSF